VKVLDVLKYVLDQQEVDVGIGEVNTVLTQDIAGVQKANIVQ
tara:strand:+ start:296 stop:421 length:126 start_codon:yes stop_codon:yes gene_type:complete